MDISTITLADLDLDPDPILAHLRAHEPVAWIPALEMWLVTRWDDVATIEGHPELFTAATEPSFLARALGPNMLTTDPPELGRIRQIMRPPFTAGGRSGGFVADELPALADRLINGLPTGPFDLMEHYAQPLSAGSLAIVLGLDDHGFDTMWSWCEGLCADIANFENDPELAARGEETKAELGAAIESRLAALDDPAASDPAPGHPALDNSAQSAIGWFAAHGATPDEIVNNVRLMISGGINEPRDGIGLVTWVLLARPDLRAQIEAEPALLRRLVEEVFRVYSPVGTVTRQTTTEVELGGVTIPAGQLVAGVLRSVNLDEEHWSHPTEIDLHRRQGAHAAFALGHHRCLGEWLGRQEVRIGVERLLSRLPDLALSPDHPVEIRGFEFRGPHSLWVRN